MRCKSYLQRLCISALVAFLAWATSREGCHATSPPKSPRSRSKSSRKRPTVSSIVSLSSTRNLSRLSVKKSERTFTRHSSAKICQVTVKFILSTWEEESLKAKNAGVVCSVSEEDVNTTTYSEAFWAFSGSRSTKLLPTWH